MARTRWRTDRLALVAALIVLVLAVGLYYIIQRGKLGDTRLASDKTLLSLLTVTIVGLLLGLAVLLVRNLARVLAGRRRGVLGSRLQARVTFAFLLLVLLPSLTLFIAAITVVRRSLSDFAPPAQAGALLVASQMADDIRSEARSRARHFAVELAQDLATGPLAKAPWPASGELVRRLDAARRRFALAAVGLAPATGSPLAVAAPPGDGAETVRASELTRLPEGFAAAVLADGRGRQVEERLAYGWRALAAELAPTSGADKAVVWAAVYIPEDTVRRLDQVAAAHANLEASGRRRPAVERLYVALFALLTFLVLFAAIWTGFLIARQVTDPILDLARGTEALASGELSYRVAERSGDEIGQLAASFNRMAREIERARTDLEGRRQYIETLLESIPVGVLSLNSAGDVTTVNHAALEVLRLDRLSVGESFGAALGPGRQALVEAIAPVLAGETSRLASELSINVKEGLVSLVATASRFPVREREESVLVVLEDLTRLRRAERLAAWGEVARRLAHEIKNPLTPIRLSAERMLRRFQRGPEGFNPVIEEGVATIVREVENIQSLVAEFSRFARLPEIRPRPGDLQAVVENAVALYRGSHPEVEFRLQLDSGGPRCEIDPEAMRRCLINILDNAVAAVGSGGQVVVSTYAQPERRSVALEVADNGPGVPPGDRKRMFQPDFSRRPGGTGLGLAIVDQIVAAHGGRIHVEDNPGGGVRLIIELPATTTQGPAASAEVV